MRRPSARAVSTHWSIVTPDTGTIGQTSSAPMRGCAPWCFDMSISSPAATAPRNAASLDRIRRADERVHRAIRVRARVHVEQAHAIDAGNRPRDRVDHRAVAALRKIRHAFDEGCHGCSCDRSYRANSCPAMSRNDLNSSALPLGSCRNIVACSPAWPRKRTLRLDDELSRPRRAAAWRAPPSPASRAPCRSAARARRGRPPGSSARAQAPRPPPGGRPAGGRRNRNPPSPRRSVPPRSRAVRRKRRAPRPGPARESRGERA